LDLGWEDPPPHVALKIQGIVTNSEDTPIAGAYCELWTLDWEDKEALLIQVKTNKNGFYSITQEMYCVEGEVWVKAWEGKNLSEVIRDVQCISEVQIMNFILQ